jgi:hypothetical protein
LTAWRSAWGLFIGAWKLGMWRAPEVRHLRREG